MIKNKGFLIALAYIIIILLTFWLTSRYPALNQKLSNPTSLSLSGIGFANEFIIEQGSALLIKILYTAMNWIISNLHGMTFGIILGAGVITMLKTIDVVPGDSKKVNAVKGLFMGSALGVCANCAVPIMESLRSSGYPKSLYIPILLASPILNPIVLTMSYTMLPPEFLGLKLLMLLMVVLLVVLIKDQPKLPGINSLSLSATETLVEIPRDLIKFIIKIIPLMMMVGILGSGVILLVPEDILISEMSVIMLPILAVISAILPVPITFDIFFVNIMISMGASLSYAMIFNLSLGIFSIYPFIAIYKSGEKKTAILIMAVVIITTTVISYIYHLSVRNNASMNSRIVSVHNEVVGKLERMGEINELDDIMKIRLDEEKFNDFKKPAGRTVERKLSQKSSGGSKIEIDEYDIEVDYYLQGLLPVTMYKHGVSTIDYNNDGWIDVFLANTTGNVKMLQNQGNGTFKDVSKQVFAGMELGDIIAGYPYDYDSDHDLDIIVLRRFDRPILLENNIDYFVPLEIKFKDDKIEHYSTVTLGDIKGDGTLEAFIGSYGVGDGWYNYGMLDTTNIKKSGWLLDRNLIAREINISKNTNVSLFTDVNGDGLVDLCVGSDLLQDKCFMNNGGELGVGELIKNSPSESMSIDSRIKDNIYFEHELFISGWAEGSEVTCSDNKSQHCKNMQLFQGAENTMDIAECEDIDNDMLYYACFASMSRNYGKEGYSDNSYEDHMELWRRGSYAQVDGGLGLGDEYKLGEYKVYPNDDGYVILELKSSGTLKKTIINGKGIGGRYDVSNIYKIPELITINIEGVDEDKDRYMVPGSVLLNKDGAGEKVRKFDAGLAWTTVYVDVDNDGDEDIYGVNGVYTHLEALNQVNQLYINRGGEYVITKNATFNLDTPSTGLAVADFNNDGTVDFLIGEISRSPRIISMENNNNWIQFEIKTKQHNSYGIGAKVSVISDGHVQTKELKMGGGFISASHPRLYFGLGTEEEVSAVEVLFGKEKYIFKNLDINKIHMLEI